MKSTRTPRHRLACALLLISVMGTVELALAGARVSPETAALEAEVSGLIGDAACTSHDQCRTLAYGAKACGGPQAYLAWSTLRTDAAALNAAADKVAARRRADISKSGMASDCRFVTDPGAYCAAAAPTPSGAAPDPLRACRLRSARPVGGQAAD